MKLQNRVVSIAKPRKAKPGVDPLANLLAAAGISATPTKAPDEFDRTEAARSLGIGPAKAKLLLDAAVARGTLTVRECRVAGKRNLVRCWRPA